MVISMDSMKAQRANLHGNYGITMLTLLFPCHEKHLRMILFSSVHTLCSFNKCNFQPQLMYRAKGNGNGHQNKNA